MTDPVDTLTHVVTTLLAVEAVRRNIVKMMINKVDVITYSAKMRELHDEINALKLEVALLKDRNAGR